MLRVDLFYIERKRQAQVNYVATMTIKRVSSLLYCIAVKIEDYSHCIYQLYQQIDCSSSIPEYSSQICSK